MSVKNTHSNIKLINEGIDKKGGSVLGHLVGPIADTERGTRNGRKYTGELWDKVFNSPIFKEQIKNGGVIGELDHPADRDEVSLEKAAIKLIDTPKREKDGLLHGTFEILNTPQGQIVYNLAKSGCTLGVSSRGNGEVDQTTQEVNPDTYQFSCFDIVNLPAVEEARLTLEESWDGNRVEIYNKSWYEYNSFNHLMEESINNTTDPEIKEELINNYEITKQSLYENLNDPTEWNKFKEEHSDYNEKFDWKTYGHLYDDTGKLIDVKGFDAMVAELLASTRPLNTKKLTEDPKNEGGEKSNMTDKQPIKEENDDSQSVVDHVPNEEEEEHPGEIKVNRVVFQCVGDNEAHYRDFRTDKEARNFCMKLMRPDPMANINDPDENPTHGRQVMGIICDEVWIRPEEITHTETPLIGCSIEEVAADFQRRNDEALGKTTNIPPLKEEDEADVDADMVKTSDLDTDADTGENTETSDNLSDCIEIFNAKLTDLIHAYLEEHEVSLEAEEEAAFAAEFAAAFPDIIDIICQGQEQDSDINPEESTDTEDEISVGNAEESLETATLLKNALEDNAKLKKELESIQKEKAATNSRVTKLENDLNTQKSIQVSASKQSLSLKKEAERLQNVDETNAKLNETIESLRQDLKEARENVNVANSTEFKQLNENYNALKQHSISKEEADKQQSNLQEELDKVTEELNTYKAGLEKSYTRYIEQAAKSARVSTQQIMNRLDEQYNLADVDRVVEDLKDEAMRFGSLPFRTSNNPVAGAKKIEIVEPGKRFPGVSKNSKEEDDILALNKATQGIYNKK